MSLNKFTDVAFGRDLGLRIGCSELDTGNITCESIDATAQFLETTVYTSLSDLQGIGVGPHPLLPNGEGSLTIPPDTIRTGSTIKVSCKGLLSCPAGALLTFRLEASSLSVGTADLLVASYVKADNSTSKHFSVDFTVVCRENPLGVADLLIFGEGGVLVDTGLAFESFATSNNVNVFRTDEALQLQVTASSNNVALNIVSRIGEIKI